MISKKKNLDPTLDILKIITRRNQNNLKLLQLSLQYDPSLHPHERDLGNEISNERDISKILQSIHD